MSYKWQIIHSTSDFNSFCLPQEVVFVVLLSANISHTGQFLSVLQFSRGSRQFGSCLFWQKTLMPPLREIMCGRDDITLLLSLLVFKHEPGLHFIAHKENNVSLTRPLVPAEFSGTNRSAAFTITLFIPELCKRGKNAFYCRCNFHDLTSFFKNAFIFLWEALKWAAQTERKIKPVGTLNCWSWCNHWSINSLAVSAAQC